MRDNLKLFNCYLNYCKMTNQNKNKLETLQNYLKMYKQLKALER